MAKWNLLTCQLNLLRSAHLYAYFIFLRWEDNFEIFHFIPPPLGHNGGSSETYFIFLQYGERSRPPVLALMRWPLQMTATLHNSLSISNGRHLQTNPELTWWPRMLAFQIFLCFFPRLSLRHIKSCQIEWLLDSILSSTTGIPQNTFSINNITLWIIMHQRLKNLDPIMMKCRYVD